MELRATDGRQREQLTNLAARLVVPGSLEERKGAARDFHGDLGRLQISQILTFLKQERYSGVLSAADPTHCYSLEISHGEIATCEDRSGRQPDGALERVLGMTHGEFRFRYHRSGQLDELGLPATRLVRDVFSITPRSPSPPG